MNQRLFLLFAFSFLLIPTILLAQPDSASGQQEEEKIADPETLSLKTKDNVSLVATYYPGRESKETPAVILVHDWGGDRMRLEPLAKYLQKELKASVIVPDLRGHGQSLDVGGSETKLDYKSFKKSEVLTAVNDIEACKKFLMSKNNEGKLNIELLAIVAVGKTALHAVNWSIADWNWPPAPGGMKQGQDIKLITLVSPYQRVEGNNIKQSLKSPLMTGRGMTPIPLQIIWADASSTSVANAKAIYREVSKPREKAKNKLLTMSKIDGARNSPTGLLTDATASAKSFKFIADEIRFRIVENKDLLAWQNRDSNK